jgi:uncharacterized protein YecT (DUF1311 family)
MRAIAIIGISAVASGIFLSLSTLSAWSQSPNVRARCLSISDVDQRVECLENSGGSVQTAPSAMRPAPPPEDRELDCRNPRDVPLCREYERQQAIRSGRPQPPVGAYRPPAAQEPAQYDMPQPSFNCARATTIIEQAICSDSTLAQWDLHMAELYRQALAIQNNSPALKADQARWRALRDNNCGGTNLNETQSCVLAMTKARVGGLAAVVAANGGNPNSSEPTGIAASSQPKTGQSSQNTQGGPTHLDPATETFLSGLSAARAGSQQAPGRTITTNPLSLPTAAPAAAPAASANPATPNENGFVDAVINARQSYGQASTDFQKGAARPARAKTICLVLQTMRVDNWVGKVITLTTNGDGKGVLGIEIGPDIQVKTWNNALSDIGSKTLVEPDSGVFVAMSKLSEGANIRFSGTFISNSTDCAQETSLTLNGSMMSPEFLFRFSEVGAAGTHISNSLEDKSLSAGIGQYTRPTQVPAASIGLPIFSNEAQTQQAMLPTPESGNYKQFCSEEWTKRGVLNFEMFNYCMSQQAEADSTLAQLVAQHSAMPWMQRAVDVAIAEWTKRGMRNEQMVAYEVSQQVDAYLDIVYASKQSGFQSDVLSRCSAEEQRKAPNWRMTLYCYKRATGAD